MPRPIADDTPVSDSEVRWVESRINATLRRFRPVLFRLPAVEAFSVLGGLTIEALKRIPPDERMVTCARWTDALTQGVRETLD